MQTANGFDRLMEELTERDVVVYIRNCDVGKIGGIPAIFRWGYSAALTWTKGPHESRRKETFADGATATEALRNVVEKAKGEGMWSGNEGN